VSQHDCTSVKLELLLIMPKLLVIAPDFILERHAERLKLGSN
jgi:hypothetical protein